MQHPGRTGDLDGELGRQHGDPVVKANLEHGVRHAFAHERGHARGERSYGFFIHHAAAFSARVKAAANSSPDFLGGAGGGGGGFAGSAAASGAAAGSAAGGLGGAAGAGVFPI